MGQFVMDPYTCSGIEGSTKATMEEADNQVVKSDIIGGIRFVEGLWRDKSDKGGEG